MSRSISQPAAPDLSEEEIHDVLRNRRRRMVIDILQSTESAVSVRELSEEIGAVESGLEPPPRKAKQSVYVSLLQTHLPKLDDLGIINYETEGKMVSVDGRLDEVTVFMETVPKYGISRTEFFAALSLLGLLTVLAAQLGVPVLASVPVFVWASIFFGLGLGTALFYTYKQGGTVFQRLVA